MWNLIQRFSVAEFKEHTLILSAPLKVSHFAYSKASKQRSNSSVVALYINISFLYLCFAEEEFLY